MVGGRSDVEREEGRTNIEADFSWCGLGLGGSVRVLALGRSWLGGGSLFGHSGGAGGGGGGWGRGEERERRAETSAADKRTAGGGRMAI